MYRCTLQPELGGGDVAVKVQRPGVLEAVSLDLYLMRNVALIMQKTLKVCVGLCSIPRFGACGLQYSNLVVVV